MRVNLFFDTFKNKDLEKVIGKHDIIRLKCYIQFKQEDDWSEVYEAIVDTGAHTTVIPLSIWKEIKYKKLGEHHIFGISNKPECAISSDIGEVTTVIIDSDGNYTNELKIRALLVHTDEVPLIVGFSGLLDGFKSFFNYKKNIAYLEE